MTEPRRPMIPMPSMRGGPPLMVPMVSVDPAFWAELAAIDAELGEVVLSVLHGGLEDDAWEDDDPA